MERFAYCVILIFSSQKFYVPGKKISLEGVFAFPPHRGVSRKGFLVNTP